MGRKRTTYKRREKINMNELKRLLKIKSIVTLLLVFTFCLAVFIIGGLEETLKTLVVAVVSFYFGTQHSENSNGNINRE